VSSAPSQADAWTIEAVLRWATDDFRARGIETPRLDAELLLAHALSSSRVQLVVDPRRPLAPDELARFREFVKRRRAHEPTAYIRGYREFYGRVFRVDGRVLVPRPDTEVLVEVALARTRAVSMCARALDLCTGSGCVAVTLARERPTSAVVATDVSEGALAVARANALRLGAYNVTFLKSDLFGSELPFARFDLVTANVPYVPSDEIRTLAADVKDFEPLLALDGGDDGLRPMRDVIAAAPSHLRRGGVLAVEVGKGQAPRVVELFERAGLTHVQVARDYARVERVVSAVLEGS
jgi:release factor glutamine methyltransferase